MVCAIGKLFILAALAATVAAQSCPCPRHYFPMCGSDGTTYGNQCTFSCAKSNKPGLTLRHEGKCRQKRMSDSATSCICTLELNQICGNNGVTYGNPCYLKCAAERNPELKEAYYGPCETQKLKKFPCACPKNYRPVCGSDYKTYANECILRCARNSKPELSLIHRGECNEA